MRLFNGISPQRRRWIILALIFCAFVLSYVDRQIVSVLKPDLKREFAIDDSGYATLVNVFVACYAACYALAGWLVDRFGAGRMMLGSLVGWSCACAGAALAKTFGQMAFFRGALGIAEPLAFPAQLRTVTIWFPARLRATANSICAAGSTIGAIVAAPLVAWLAIKFNWHMAFVVPGALGLVVAACWWIFYRDPPAEIKAQVAAGSVAEKGFSWPQLWRTRSLWGILLSRFISDPVWYFCLLWLPGYLQEQSGLSLAQIGYFGWIPFLAADLGGVGSSALSDFFVKRGIEPLRARKLTLAGAAIVAPVCAFTPHLPHAFATIAIFCVVGIVCLTWLFNLGVVVAEAFPAANVGSVWGIAGAFGAAGAMVFNEFVGRALTHYGPVMIFAVMAVLHPIAAVVLCKMVRKEKPRDGAKHNRLLSFALPALIIACVASGIVLLKYSGGKPSATVSTSAFQAGNAPLAAFDGDPATRWSAQGNGQWLRVDFEKAQEVGAVEIAFASGDRRNTFFVLEASADGSTWETVFEGQSSGKTLAPERFAFEKRAVRSLRYTGYGNADNDWNSVNEWRIIGADNSEIKLAFKEGKK